MAGWGGVGGDGGGGWSPGRRNCGEEVARPGKQVARGIGVRAMREWKVPRRG